MHLTAFFQVAGVAQGLQVGYLVCAALRTAGDVIHGKVFGGSAFQAPVTVTIKYLLSCGPLYPTHPRVFSCRACSFGLGQ